MEAVLGATIQVVLQNVLSSISEINLAFDYEQDLTQLSSSLEMIQKYLYDAEEKQVSGHAVQHWLNRLEDVAFEADAVLDEVKYKLLRRQVKKQNRESNQVQACYNFSSGLIIKWIFKLKMSGEIKHVITKLEKTNKEARSYGLQMAVAVASKTNTSTPPERETDSFSLEPYIVGRENDVSEIVEKLVTATPEETISVIPIVGMGGIGKTTLARKVFHDEKIGNHFAEKIWVCVSFDFDLVPLFKIILETLTQEEANVTKEVALQKVKKHLAGKRYLLVLDDVWNEKSYKWNDFMTTLSNISDVKGNCIVVTTRKQNIASDVRTLPTHQLLGLSASQCWSIIKAETFKGMDVHGEFEKIGMCIAERCGGLPLAAKVVGGLLRGESEEYWRRILENKLSDSGKDDGDDKIKKILRLSYDNLPSLPLKKCFAYCSVFPQNFKIERQYLIELWMAEGFLQGDNKGNDMETVGINFFNHLLQYSLFQDAERDVFGDIVHCKVHDLFHDLACSITKDMHQVRYLAIESNTNEPPAILPEQMMYLRTLFFNGKISNDAFSNFKCLHVLKLTGQKINELPPAIEKLIHLRSLDISGTKVECLPDSIGKLYHLQTLRVAHYFKKLPNTILDRLRNLHFLRKLPNTIIDLVSLRHLHISDLTKLPPGIGKLTHLQTLSHYDVRDEKGCGIGELGNLKNLKGVLKIVNLQRVKDKEEAELADLYRKPGIVKLVFKWNGDGDTKHENVLDGLQPHPRLKHLEITGYEGKNFPLWTMRMVAHNEEPLNNLIEIKLTKCTRCEELPMLGRLPHLRFLELYDLGNVRYVGPLFYGCVNFSLPKVAFPALEELKLSNMPELTEWIDMEGVVTVFPCLKDLKIFGCRKLETVQSNFPRLYCLEIRYCPKLKRLQSLFPCLQKLKVYNSDAEFILTNVCRNASNLKELTIDCCPGLKSITYDARGGQSSLRILSIIDCHGLTNFSIELLGSRTSSLEELQIVSCRGLKSITYDTRGGQSQEGLTSLRKLIIRDCFGLTHFPIELLESCASLLEQLTLCDLENLDTLVPCVWTMPRLQYLFLAPFPKSMILPAENCCLTSLRWLNIRGLSESTHDQLNRLFRECRSLEHLFLDGKEDWDSPPSQIQHLTTLRDLALVGFGFDALPEWIENLSSLQDLNIYNCKWLRHLPSKEAMQRLTKLERLSISGCPLLKVERYSPTQQQTTPVSADDDSEWPKISHIQEVWIDFQPLPTRNSPEASPSEENLGSSSSREKVFGLCFK